MTLWTSININIKHASLLNINKKKLSIIDTWYKKKYLCKRIYYSNFIAYIHNVITIFEKNSYRQKKTSIVREILPDFA